MFMKRPIVLLTSLFALSGILTAFIIRSRSVKANEILMPLGTDLQISLMDLATISVKELEKLTGRHLTFVDRFCFKAGQKELKNTIKADGTINDKKFIKLLNQEDL